jgi:hypothetical protein
MAAIGDTVVQILAPPPAADQHQVGIAPVLVGQVIAAGTGAPGADWNVLWNNGAVSIDHDNTVLRVLVTPFQSANVGRRARPLTSIGAISPSRIGIVRMRDANDVYVLEMDNGKFYTLSAANIEFLD